MEALPLAYREVLILRDVQSYSITETAKFLGLTAGTVKTRLRIARQVL